MVRTSRSGKGISGWLEAARGMFGPAPPRGQSDLFQSRAASPMWPGREQNKAFDHDAYFFEPILGGDRVFAYLNRQETVLTGSNAARLPAAFPELVDLHRQVTNKCVLDGEIVIFKDGAPCREAYEIRLSLERPEAVRQAGREFPAVFVAQDVVYQARKQVDDQPLLYRRSLLERLVSRSDKMLLSHLLRGQGLTLFNAVRQRNLAGVVAKHKTSQYYFGYGTPDWVCIKDSLEDDYIVCGHTSLENRPPVLILGQFDRRGGVTYGGRAAFHGSAEERKLLQGWPRRPSHPFLSAPPLGSLEVAWLAPLLWCRVGYTARDETGKLHNPVFKRLTPEQDLGDLREPERAFARVVRPDFGSDLGTDFGPDLGPDKGPEQGQTWN